MVSACNSKMVSIGISLWLLLAGITMSLSSCGSGDGGESVPLQTSFAPSISITFANNGANVLRGLQ